MRVGSAELLVLVGLLVVPVLLVLVWWRILVKAGYPGALGLLMLAPLANVVLVVVLAFTTWPIERELTALRASLSES